MAGRSYRDLAAYWRKHFPVDSDLPDERLVLRILKEYPSFGHDLAGLADLYAKTEYDSIPLQRDWSEAKWQAAIEQWREALEFARTLNLHQLRRPSGIPIPLMGRRVGAAPSSRMLLVPLLAQEQTCGAVCVLRHGFEVLCRPAVAVRDRQRWGRSHGLLPRPAAGRLQRYNLDRPSDTARHHHRVRRVRSLGDASFRQHFVR